MSNWGCLLVLESGLSWAFALFVCLLVKVWDTQTGNDRWEQESLSNLLYLRRVTANYKVQRPQGREQEDPHAT